MKGLASPNFEGFCPRCLQRDFICLCDLVPTVEARTEILIVRHYKEQLRTSNTARMAALALPRSRMMDIKCATDPIDPAPFREPGTWLLYPGFDPPAAPPSPPVRRLVVLDGTWRQTRRMYLHMNALRGLPVLSLPPPSVAQERMREQTREEGHSTLEAIAAALRFLEGEQVAGPLEQMLAGIVQRVFAFRGRKTA